MNLRHIDPRSSDWMDAMLEEGGHAGRERHGKRDTGAHVEPQPEQAGFLSAAAGVDAGELEQQGSRPPPGR